MSRLLLAFSLFKTHHKGSCVELRTPCSFSIASPVPSHHLGSALADVHVQLHALPCHKWSVFVCVGGVVGKIAGSLQWALRSPITGPVLQLSGEGFHVGMKLVLGVGALLRHTFCGACYCLAVVAPTVGFLPYAGHPF